MKIAIVGAGVSGLCAAYFLLKRDPNARVVVFEKSPSVGGRMSTRRLTNNVAIDTGCQFLSIDDEHLKELFLEIAPSESLRELPYPILCLPEGWVVEPAQRYYFTDGMATWSERLLARLKDYGPRFEIRFESPVRDGDALWKEGFDAAFVSAPGPQAESFGQNEPVEYRPCLNLTFAWKDPPVETAEIFAYRDTSGRKGLGWLAHEGLKRGQSEIWVAQLDPEASLEWYRDGQNTLDHIEDLLEKDLADWVPLFKKGSKTLLDLKFWKHAFPLSGLDPSRQHGFERRDAVDGRPVFFIGDGHLGVGRAENAMESARRAVESFLNASPSQTKNA